MEVPRPNRRRFIVYGGAALGVLAIAAAVGVYAKAQQDTVRGRFETSCVDGCIETRAPKASCREVCACLLADLETGRTEAELDAFLEKLDHSTSTDSPEIDDLKASQERCLSGVVPRG